MQQYFSLLTIVRKQIAVAPDANARNTKASTMNKKQSRFCIGYCEISRLLKNGRDRAPAISMLRGVLRALMLAEGRCSDWTGSALVLYRYLKKELPYSYE